MEREIPNGAHLTNQDFVKMYEKMLEIRFFEMKLQELYDAGKIYGTMHLCVGQEATAAGSGYLLQKSDLMTSTHRNHGHSLAKGTDMTAMFAEILGKVTGTNGGKGGSMHIADLTVGNLGSNGIVGGNFPIAAGAALTFQMQEKDNVVVCYSGDGSTNEGSFHEALNLASVWQLPVIFFIENNHYAMSTSIDKTLNIADISTRAVSYGIPGVTIDGNDLLEVVDTVHTAIERARNGAGPTLIEAKTYRNCGHSKSDKLVYRSRHEEAIWEQELDPIVLVENLLVTYGVLSETEISQRQSFIFAKVQQAAQVAEQAPAPALEELWTNVYAN